MANEQPQAPNNTFLQSIKTVHTYTLQIQRRYPHDNFHLISVRSPGWPVGSQHLFNLCGSEVRSMHEHRTKNVARIVIISNITNAFSISPCIIKPPIRSTSSSPPSSSSSYPVVTYTTSIVLQGAGDHDHILLPPVPVSLWQLK